MFAFSHVLLVDSDSTASFLHQRLLSRMKIAPDIWEATTEEDAIQALDRVFETTSEQPRVLVLVGLKIPVLTYLKFFQACRQLTPSQKECIQFVTLTMDQPVTKFAHVAGLPLIEVVKPLTEEKVQSILATAALLQ